MKLPTLFSRTSTGAIQEWTIEVDAGRYRMESGQQCGKKVVSEWTVCKPKNVGRANETDAQTQAELEAKSKWDKKAKTGYFESVEDIDKALYIEPMTAKKYFDRLDKITYPVAVQTKFNGVRCVATKDGLFSRKGEKFVSIPHIFETLKPFFKIHPNAFLDGELFSEEYRQKLNRIVSLCRKQDPTEEELNESKAIVEYFVYDGYGFDGVSRETPYTERLLAIERRLSNFPYYQPVETEIANSHEEVMKMFEKRIAYGHEGIMVRIIDSPYEHKRSANLLKCKPTDDSEFVIVDIVEGDGNLGGMAGKVICKMEDGRTFGANIKGGRECNKDIWNYREKYIGQKVTITYNGFTGKGDGLPNFAQFDASNYLLTF